MNKYILDESGNPVLEPDILKWAKWFESTFDGEYVRRVAITDIGEEVSIITSFLALDHQWGDGSPLLYETMVFGGKLNGEQDRYSTKEEAVSGHERIVQLVKEAENAKDHECEK